MLEITLGGEFNDDIITSLITELQPVSTEWELWDCVYGNEVRARITKKNILEQIKRNGKIVIHTKENAWKNKNQDSFVRFCNSNKIDYVMEVLTNFNSTYIADVEGHEMAYHTNEEGEAMVPVWILKNYRDNGTLETMVNQMIIETEAVEGIKATYSSSKEVVSVGRK